MQLTLNLLGRLLMATPLVGSTLFKRWLVGLGMLLLVFILLAFFFPWDLLRGPLNSYVSKELGRRFEITERLSVKLGLTATVRADGIEFANPEWASEPYLIKAKAAEFDIKLFPLLLGKVDLPRIALFEPQVGLQIEPDGRRTWTLSRDTTDSNATPKIGALTVDRGTLKYRASGQGADLTAIFTLAAEASATQTSTGQLPLSYKVAGKWNGEAFTANGRAGGVLQLSRDLSESFPIEINAQSGNTALKAKGTVENLQEFSNLNAAVDIQGRNLDELYKLAGVVLPSTPPYKLRGQLTKRGKVWDVTQVNGVLGKSDLFGELSFDPSQKVPALTGKVSSKVLDFDDLRPVIGLPVKTGNAETAKKGITSTGLGKPLASAGSAGKVLPTAILDLVKFKAMNADVTYSALDIRHVEELPLDKGSVHVLLNNGVLRLEPLNLGVAGGSLIGKITIDANAVPAAVSTKFDLKAVQLNKLFPTIENTKSSFGRVSGQVALDGRGNSLAQMLGSASGDVAVLTGKGNFSNILLEFMGLDGGEVIKFFLRGDRNVLLRCAAAAFEVKQGLMSSKVILLDTSDTVIKGSGQISLKNETLDIVLKPEPKDVSILSLRSPLRIGGTFAAPVAGPDKAALAGRAGLAVALGVINPFLGLLATIETGPGEDADCPAALGIATNPAAKAQAVPAKTPAR